jgi:hypothetical protein
MTKDPLTHALIGHAMKTHRDLGPGLDEEFYHQNFVSRLLQVGISKAIIPQIQGQPQIETDQASLGLGSVVPTTALLDSSRLPESLPLFRENNKLAIKTRTNSCGVFHFPSPPVSGRLSKNKLEIAMQNPSIWERLRAVIHQKTTPEPKPTPVRIPTFLWTFLTLIGTTLITGVGWTILTNQFHWKHNLTATGLIALFGLFMFSWPLSNWIQTERSKEARKADAEARLIEDRQKAEALAAAIREDDRLEKIRKQEHENALREEQKALREEQKARRRKGAIRNLWGFLVGEND